MKVKYFCVTLPFFADRMALEGTDRDVHRQLEAGRAPGILPLALGHGQERNAKFDDQVICLNG